MKELQLNFIEWSELEDPNSVSSTILMELKKLGFACVCVHVGCVHACPTVMVD